MDNTLKHKGNSVYLYANSNEPVRYITNPRSNQPVTDRDFIFLDGRKYFKALRQS